MIKLCKCCFYQETEKVLETEKESKEALIESKNDEIIITKESQTILHTKLSDQNVEEDSGTCSDLQVQLTVSSVNSILPDLPEESTEKLNLLDNSLDNRLIAINV